MNQDESISFDVEEAERLGYDAGMLDGIPYPFDQRERLFAGAAYAAYLAAFDCGMTDAVEKVLNGDPS